MPDGDDFDASLQSFLAAVATDVETERGRTLALAAPEELLREETPRWLEEEEGARGCAMQ